MSGTPPVTRADVPAPSRWVRWLALGPLEALARLVYRLRRWRSDDPDAVDYREWIRRFEDSQAGAPAEASQDGDFVLQVDGETLDVVPDLPRIDAAALAGDPSTWPAALQRVLLVGPGRLLHARARLALQQALRGDGVQFAYADEDRVGRTGRRHAPRFKPTWDPELLLEEDYASGLAMVSRDALRAACTRPLPATGTRYAMVLRLARHLHDAEVARVPRVLSHVRDGVDAVATGRDAALRDWLDDEPAGSLAQALGAGTDTRITWSAPSPLPLVSVIIPTRDQAGHLRRCLESLAATDYAPLQLVLVDNGTLDADALAVLGRAAAGGATVIRRDEAFNFSRLVNAGVVAAQGQMLCLLNNDVEIRDPGWLRELVALASRPGAGAVGAMLRFPDGGIQHAGILVGMHDAAVNLQDAPPTLGPRPGDRPFPRRRFSAVTAACLLVPRAAFDEVGGFDEAFEVRFNDVDFCLRLGARGLQVVWTPDAVLVHHESATRSLRATSTGRELNTSLARLQQRWPEVMRDDPCYNPNLALDDAPYRLTLLPRPAWAGDAAR